MVLDTRESIRSYPIKLLPHLFDMFHGIYNLPFHLAGYSKASSISYFMAPHAGYRFPQIRDNSTAVPDMFFAAYCLSGHLVFVHIVHIHVRTHTRNDDLPEGTESGAGK